jgi:hypothetical protein
LLPKAKSILHDGNQKSPDDRSSGLLHRVIPAKAGIHVLAGFQPALE